MLGKKKEGFFMEKESKIKLLQDVVKIKSVNGDEREVALYLQDVLKRNGINSELVAHSNNRSNLVAEIGNNSGKVLGFSGHMDVVAAGDESEWLYPPFSGHIEGDKLYGRGATDMKGGLVAMVIAMIELKEQGLPEKGKIKLLATVGEEVGELGSEQLTKEGYADDLDGLIIGEPTHYQLIYTHKGSINYTVTSIGKAAHSSMPEFGYNAIAPLNTYMNYVNEKMAQVIKGYESEELGRTIHNVTIIEGGQQVNSIPDKAVLQGNIRSIPEFDNDKIITLLKDIIDQMNKNNEGQVSIEINYNKIPVKANKESDLIKSIQKQFDKNLPVLGLSGTTDAAEFTKSSKPFDFVIFGPGESKLAHQVDEYISLTNYLDMIDKYQLIAKDYLK